MELRQDGQKTFNITVDDDELMEGQLTVSDLQRNVFDMYGPLYVGGLPAHLLPPASRPPHGLNTAGQRVSLRAAFVGCLATLTVNGLLFDPVDDLPVLPPAVVQGCRSEQQLYSSVSLLHRPYMFIEINRSIRTRIKRYKPVQRTHRTLVSDVCPVGTVFNRSCIAGN